MQSKWRCSFFIKALKQFEVKAVEVQYIWASGIKN